MQFHNRAEVANGTRLGQLSVHLNPFTVVLADDHHMVRRAFAELLAKEPDIEVIGEAANIPELLQAVDCLKPDVLLLDAHMPGGRVINAARLIRKMHPEIEILVVSAYENSEYVVGLIRAGVTGYVLKQDSSEILLAAIRSVARGEEWLSPRIAHVLAQSVRNFEEGRRASLTEREIQVLSCMAKGSTNEQIAETLVITQQTVKNHVSRIFHKLGVENRVDAVLYAIEHELDTSAINHRD